MWPDSGASVLFCCFYSDIMRKGAQDSGGFAFSRVLWTSCHNLRWGDKPVEAPDFVPATQARDWKEKSFLKSQGMTTRIKEEPVWFISCKRFKNYLLCVHECRTVQKSCQFIFQWGAQSNLQGNACHYLDLIQQTDLELYMKNDLLWDNNTLDLQERRDTKTSCISARVCSNTCWRHRCTHLQATSVELQK